MRPFSAIVVLVIALCLAQAVYSRGLNTGGFCSDEFQCDESKCIKMLQICDNTTDCTDGSDESGCDCLLKGLLSCEGKCIDKEQFCNGFPCRNMKGNVTCSNDLQGSASNLTEVTANSTTNITKMENNMKISDNKFNMAMDDKNTNVTMENNNTNMTMKNNNTNMTMEDNNTNMTMKNNNANMTMENKNIIMTIGDKNSNMTSGNKNTNVTMGDKNSNMTMENEKSNATSDDKISEMIIDDKNTNMTLENKTANKNNEDSQNFTMVNEPIESKKNMLLNNAMTETKGANESRGISNSTIMNEIVFDYGNSTEDSINVTEFDSIPRSEESTNVTMEGSGFTMEGDMEFNVTESDAYSNETEVCNMSYSIACEEFDPPCILAVAYCNYSIPCPNQIRSDVCGEDGLPLSKRKTKLSNLVDLQEPEEKNFINSTQESGRDEHATKESLKVAESETGDNHLKIIIPVVVIGGLCLVVIIVWFITRRNKNVDSYALQ